MDSRPPLTKRIAVKDFQEFYWLKKELVEFCRTIGLKTTGNKLEIANRILVYLETGSTASSKKVSSKPKSKFDWNNDVLSSSTIITDNYKNTENVRAYFTNQIGKHFKFNVKFMAWMRSNCGKTLQDAAETWKKIIVANRVDDKPKDIAPQFEYNRYLRDFLAANPNRDRAEGIKLWKIKKTKRGDNAYSKKDLKFLK